MVISEKPKSVIRNYIIVLVITCIVKVIIDVITTFILSIPYGEDVPVLAFAIYLVPSVGVLAAFALWFLHNRLHHGRFKIGLYTAIISAIVIEAIIVPWTYDLPGEDLPLMLTWGLSFLSLIIAIGLGLIGYLRQIKEQ